LIIAYNIDYIGIFLDKILGIHKQDITAAAPNFFVSELIIIILV